MDTHHKGPLNLCITVFGQVPPGQELRRSGAPTRSGSAASFGDGWRSTRCWARSNCCSKSCACTPAARAPDTASAPAGAARHASAAADVATACAATWAISWSLPGVGAELDADALLASDAISADLRALPRERALHQVLAGRRREGTDLHRTGWLWRLRHERPETLTVMGHVDGLAGGS